MTLTLHGLSFPKPRTRTHQARRLWPAESEDHFLGRVLELARVFGWQLQYHTFDSRRSQPGFPDVVVVRAPRVVFLELKTDYGRLTLPQEAWRSELGRCPGVEHYVIRPKDWQRLERILGRRRTSV